MNADRPLMELLREAAHRLAGIGAGNPRLEAEYLLAHALDVERIALFRRRDADPIPGGARSRFDRLLERRLGREPLQYVLGTVPFCDLDLEIGPGSLIPRSETEVLVERVAEAAGGLGPEVPRLVVDVGTGSGAILLALLRRLAGWSGIGLDRSRAALAWARRNRLRSGFESRTLLLQGDLCAPLRPGSAGIVVSNPPYIRTGELPALAPEIREHEPREALDGGDDGLGVVRRLLPEASWILRPGGLMALELAPDQPQVVLDLLQRHGGFGRALAFQDLAARPRGVLAWRIQT